MLIRRRKAQSSLKAPEIGADSCRDGWRFGMDSRGQKDGKLPAPGAPCAAGVLWAGGRSHPAPTLLSPCSHSSNSQLSCNFGGLEPWVPEPAISPKNWIILRNHRVASHKNQIIQTKWEKWGSLRHFEAFQLLLKHLPRETSQYFQLKPIAANPDPNTPSQLHE